MLRACGAAILGHAGIGAGALAAAGGRGFAASAAANAAKVGLIGLGRIGSRFLPRLLDAGHDVVLHDRNRLAVSRCLEVGKAHPSGS
ncbi:MAG: hypothetical protein J3K34DRAFT_422656 [Monoraphidium minutum]|nr:MAG: hypothetical protein J3K34DRAFT_422656 [Monoraphidium minutum]